jgi:hypothetical protein
MHPLSNGGHYRFPENHQKLKKNKNDVFDENSI